MNERAFTPIDRRSRPPLSPTAPHRTAPHRVARIGHIRGAHTVLFTTIHNQSPYTTSHALNDPRARERTNERTNAPGRRAEDPDRGWVRRPSVLASYLRHPITKQHNTTQNTRAMGRKLLSVRPHARNRRPPRDRARAVDAPRRLGRGRVRGGGRRRARRRRAR